MLEKWKTIEEDGIIKDAYLISNKGRIRMRTRTYYCGKPKVKRVIKGGLMKPSITAKKYSSGYYAQPLRRTDGGQKTFFVHRLVAKYFLKDWNEDLTVNHKDENTLNNEVTNLEMLSMKDNNNYGTREERARESLSKRKDKRTIKPTRLERDGEVKYFRSISATAEYLGCGKAKVRSCLLGQRNHVHGWKITEQ